jgi:hypothetical protein
VTTAPPGPWIRSPKWDLAFIVGSGVLVSVPLATYYGVAALTGVPPHAFQEQPALNVAMAVNLGCAFFIGGPHLYATYTMTVAERAFRQRYPALLWAALLVPAVVVALALVRIQLLMTLFFAWASVHAVHQLTYIVQQYQVRAGGTARLPTWSKGIDYLLAMSCLYPVVFWRLLAEPGAVLRLPFGLEIAQGFPIGAVDISRELPAIVHGQVWIAWIAFAVFGVSLAAFVVRSLWELATGTMIWPRALLLATTVPIVFSVPLFRNLDVSLQGFNLWHSTQYIGLVYLMNAYRKERQEISSRFIRSLSGFGNGRRYYGFVVALSVAAGGLIGILHYGIGLPMLHAYYGVHLSALWVHYLWDHAVFTQADALTPMAVLA